MRHPESDTSPAPVYDASYVAKARELCARGAGESDLAAAFGVSIWAIKLWRTTYTAFNDAIRIAREVADDRVTMALYERCVGYSYDAIKPMVVSQGKGEPAIIEEYRYKEHAPPDVGACRYWLNNRRPDIWRERVEQVNVNRDDVKQLTDAELTKIIRTAGPGSAGDAGATDGAQKSGKLH